MAIVSSAASTTQTATPTLTSWWLKDPLDSSLNKEIRVSSWAPAKNHEAAKFDPIGRSRSIVLQGDVRGEEGQLGYRTMSETEFNNIEALLNSRDVLLLQNTVGQQWYVAVLSGQQRQMVRAVASSGSGMRHWYDASVQFVEVDIP